MYYEPRGTLGALLDAAEALENGKKPGPLKDSGTRRTFETGAVRDGSGPEKGAPHLRPVHALHALDVHMAKGAAKYDARNWEKGIPLSVFFDSAQRHADKLLAGYVDEDHAAAWLWNVACYIETQHRIAIGLLPPALDDMPQTFCSVTPEF
jgi:hypothetical protein